MTLRLEFKYYRQLLEMHALGVKYMYIDSLVTATKSTLKYIFLSHFGWLFDMKHSQSQQRVGC